jgi:Arm DNA-binding domain
MPKSATRLDAVVINAAKPGLKVRKLFDGDGLQLSIMPEGKKYWRADFRINGVRKDYAIGAYPKICLAEARKQAQEARALAARPMSRRMRELFLEEAQKG